MTVPLGLLTFLVAAAFLVFVINWAFKNINRIWSRQFASVPTSASPLDILAKGCFSAVVLVIVMLIACLLFSKGATLRIIVVILQLTIKVLRGTAQVLEWLVQALSSL